MAVTTFFSVLVNNQSIEALDQEQDETHDDHEEAHDSQNSGFYDKNAMAEAPRFTKKLLSTQVKPAGNMVRMKCPAEGNPVPNITWYKNDKTPVTRNLGTIRSTRWQILLEDLVTSDSGNYTCQVCNIKGCISFTYKLEIVGKLYCTEIFIDKIATVNYCKK